MHQCYSSIWGRYFDIFYNSLYSFLWPEYFIDFLCENGSPCQALTSVLCLLYCPETVHCSTKNTYSFEIIKVLMQGKLFQKFTHFLYCSVLSLGGKVSQDGCRSLTWNPFSQKQSIEYSGLRKLLCEFSKLSKLNVFILLRYRQTLMHLLLFTNSAQRELVSICMQSIRDRN